MKRIIVESSYGSIWREIMDGITWFVRDRRLAWQISCVTSEELIEAIQSGAHGAICLVRRSNRPMVRRLLASRIPAVNLLQAIHPKVPSIMSDNPAIGQAAAEYLYGKGFRRFAYVGVERIWSEEREAGFCRRLAELGHQVARCPVPMEPPAMRLVTSAAIRRALSAWLRDLKRPIALFACADFVGRAMIELCLRAGISVPEEFAILGVDNDPAICELSPVPLSSIPQNMRRIGFEAARVLERLMRHRSARRSLFRIAPREIVIRRSTDFIAIENAQVASALRYITATDAERLDMKGLLRQVGVSRQWLDRQFRQTIGSTPSEQIRRKKLARARSLLVETHLSVQAVALRSGFTQGENLSRFFKDHVGLSPREFRRKHGYLE